MNHITIKGLHADDMVEVETYDTDTNGVSGHAVKVADLARWLEPYRPCHLYVQVSDDSLQHLVCTVGRSIPGVYLGTAGRGANVR
jgi:hypothetical protein